MTVAQTKGYLRLEGKIWGLNNKEPFTNSVKRNLSFGLQSSKTNTNYVQVGDWINSTLTVNVKANPEDEVLKLGEQEAVNYIKENFKDSDSVYINIRADVDTFHKKLNWIVSSIYKKSEPIDFDASDFKEVNELSQPIIITEKPINGMVKAGLTTYKGEMLELDLALEDDIVRGYMEENAKVGDLIPVTISVDNRPIYEEGKTEDSTKERTTLKGKKIGGNNSNGNYRKIKERNLVLAIIDIDTEKAEKGKYSREEIREALDSVNNKPASTSQTTNDSVKVEDDDMPY